MGQVFFRTVNITGGSQFLGTEFTAAGKSPSRILKVREIVLNMGIESKGFEIQKVFTQGGVTVKSQINVGIASTVTNVFITGADAEILLLSGEQIQIVTTGASSAMQARVLYEELDNSQERAPNDPKVTR